MPVDFPVSLKRFQQESDLSWSEIARRLAPPLCGARAAAPAHPALHAPHQRQGGALHPNPAAHMGLRLRLPDQRPPHAGARWLAPEV